MSRRLSGGRARGHALITPDGDERPGHPADAAPGPAQIGGR